MRWRWVLLLPVAIVLVLVASASRLQIFWWPDELREETRGRQGEVVEVVDRWTDEANGGQERRLAVMLVDVRPALSVEGYSGPEPVEPPAGVAVWEIVLEFHVDPSVPLGGCQVSLFDEEGREALAEGGTVGEVDLPYTACEPENRRGPAYDGTRDEDTLPRLPTYRVAMFALSEAGVEPTTVRLWWEAPDYVDLEVIRR